MYPGLALLLFCCLYRPSTSLEMLPVDFAVLHFTTPPMLYHYDPQNYDRKAPIILLVSAGMLCCLYYFYKIIWKYYVHDETGTATNAKTQTATGRRASGHTASTRSAAGLGQRLREYFLSPRSPFLPKRESVSRNWICACCWQSVFCTVALPSMIWETAKLRQQLMICRENYRPSSWNSPKMRYL